MGLTRQRDIDDDPRPYVAGLRQFAAARNVALADASLRYGRLWRQGMPVQHADAEFDQSPRRPRHADLRRQPAGAVSVNEPGG